MDPPVAGGREDHPAIALRILLGLPPLPYPEVAEPEPPPPTLTRNLTSVLTSDLLEEILLRVASPADLACASAACVSFRRIIADQSFLRRYRSIHPPLLLGSVSASGFHPVEAPHPSTVVARAVAFSFDFLPTTIAQSGCWLPCHVHDGRVLLWCHSRLLGSAGLEFAVCDPLSRRYLLLPPITDDLLASVEIQKQNSMFDPRASLIASRGIEEDTSFSVIVWMQSDKRLGVLVFSSVSGCWSVSASTNCYILGLNEFGRLGLGHCAYDCFYWKLWNMSTLIKLDMNTMQFCTFDLPPGHDKHEIVIVESGRNKVAMFSMDYEGTSLDYYTFSQNGNENSHQWHMMSTISLPADYNIKPYFVGRAQGCIFLAGIPVGHGANHRVLFSLETKSFKIERVAFKKEIERVSAYFSGHTYFGYPPSMSPIRIQGYGEIGMNHEGINNCQPNEDDRLQFTLDEEVAHEYGRPN